MGGNQLANEFDVKVLISTAEATGRLRALNVETKNVDATLRALDSTLKSTQGGLTATAKAISSIIASQRQAAKGSKEMAQAAIAETRAHAVAQQASDRHAESQARLATQMKRTERAQQSIIQANERKAASDARAAQRTREHEKSAIALQDSLSNSRYLLYDVGATYRAMSIALLAAPAATTAVATAFEKDFAQVIRTTGVTDEAVGKLRNELKKLATEIPISFAELSKIATIGGQLGIEAKDIGQFTETVAKFLASTDVPLENATALFGRMQNSFNPNGDIPDFFNKIGSAIAFTGVNAVATEKEISALLSQIAPLAANAGFAADETVGLASAMASVRIRPELARGTLTAFFGRLNTAVSEGSPLLGNYATLMDETTDSVKKLYDEDPAQFFQDFIGALSKLDKYEKTDFLASVGIKERRDSDALIKLAGGFKVLEDAMKDTDEAFTKGTFLTESTKGVFGTFAANLQKLASAFANVLDSLGNDALPILSAVTDGLTGFVQGFNRMLDNVPGLKAVVNALLGFGGVVGVFLALKSAQAFVLAGLIGFQQVAGKQALQSALSLKGNIQQLAISLVMAKGATQAEAAALVQLNGNMGAVAAQTAIYNRSLMSATGTTNVFAARASMAAGAVRGFAGAIFSLAGGVAGLAIASLFAIGTALDEQKRKYEAAGEAAATFGRDSKEAAQEILNSFDDNGIGNAFTNTIFNAGSTISDKLKATGIAEPTLAAAISGNKDAIRELNDELDRYAQSKGFKDANDLLGASFQQLNPEVAIAQNNVRNLRDALNDGSASLSDAKIKADTNKESMKALGHETEETGEAYADAGAKVETFDQKLNTVINRIFGMVNSEAALQAALEKLGGGIQATNSFGPESAEARANMANLQETISAAALHFQQLIENGKLTAKEAASEYGIYIDGLVTQLTSMGVPPEEIAAITMRAKQEVQATLDATPPAEVKAEVVATVNFGSIQDAQTVLQTIQDQYGTLDSTVLMDLEGGEETVANAHAAVQYISQLTGIDQQVILDALTDPAADKSRDTIDAIGEATGTPFVFTLDSDAAPAINAVGSFVDTALRLLSPVYALAQMILGAMGTPVRESNIVGPVVSAGVSAPAPAQQVQQRAPKMRQTANAPTLSRKTADLPDFGGLKKGYDDVGNAAKDSADKAAKGADKQKDAVDKARKSVQELADDYSNRLAEALNDTFNKTYGVQIAQDDYAKQANAAKKRRQDEIGQVRDLTAKIKELQIARRGDLVTARKAMIEAGISKKYGETDRYKDYLQQADAAKQSASEKTRNIATTIKERDAIKAGIGVLTGNTDAAIRNREELRSLERAALDLAIAYQGSGRSISQTGRFLMVLRGRIAEQVASLGYNKVAVDNVRRSFQSYINTAKAVPLRVKTTAENNFNSAKAPASTYNSAVRQIPQSRYTSAGGNWKAAGAKVDGYKRKIASVPRVIRLYADADIREAQRKLDYLKANSMIRANQYARGDAYQNYQKNTGGLVGNGFASGGLIPGTPPSNPRKDNLLAKVDGHGVVAVRSQEFIQPQEAVDYYGLDFMEQIRRMKLPKFNAGGAVSGSGGRGGSNGAVQVVELTAENIKLLQSLADRPIDLYAGAEKLASTVAEGNKIIATKGGVL